MDISFDRINQEMQNIVSDFEKLLTDGKYDEAKQAIDDIMNELSANADIELDQDNENDNNFHKLYKELTKKIDDRETSHASPAAGNTTDYDALKQALELATESIFKTAEIRQDLVLKDPDQNEYKQALQEGIASSQLEKEELQKLQDKYNYIEHKIFFDKTTSPEKDRREIIAESKLYNEQLQKLTDTIDEINRLKSWITDPAHATSMYDAAKTNYATQIDTMKQGMKDKIQELHDKGLDTTTLADLTEDANITSGDSKNKTEALKNKQLISLATQYEEIRKQFENAQNGVFSYTDKDGNTINIKDEEVIRLMPDMKLLIILDPKAYPSKTGAEKAKIEDSIKKIDDAIKAVEEKSEQIKNKIDIEDQKMEIFADHVKIIDIENGILDRDADDREAYINEFDSDTKQKIDDEKKFRHDDCRAKTYGDKEKAKEYKERWKRFQEHRKNKTEKFTKSDGTEVDYNYEYIEDYPEKEDDLRFMQLESWEEKSKKISLCQVVGIEEGYSDEYKNRLDKLSQELQDLQNAGKPKDEIDAKSEEINQLKGLIKQRFLREVDYVKNYNSSHFDSRDTVAILKTGGSAMMVRNNGGKVTAKDRAAAIFKWTSFKEKADGKRHVIRTAISNVAGLASLPVRTLETVIGLGAAGVRYLGSKISGTYDMPTPYKVGASARKEARQEYYMNNGSTAFGAWFKSWFNFKVPDGNGNKVKLTEKLIQDRCKVIDESVEDKWIRHAKVKLLQDKENAKRNQKARKASYKNMSKSSEIYEDIYDNYATLNKDDVAKKAMQRSILTFGGKTAVPITDQSESFVKGGRKRDGKFVQRNPGDSVGNMNLDLVNELDFSGTIGDTVWTNSVSRKNILRGKTKNIDRGLKIAASATLLGLKYFLSRPKIVEDPSQNVNPGDIQTNQKSTIWEQRPKYKTQTIDVEETTEIPITYENATVGDCVRGDTAYWSADLGAHTAHAPGTFTSSDTVTQGINFRFTDVSGNNISYSIGDEAIKQYIDTHPNCSEFSNAYGVLNISDSTKISDLHKLLPDSIKQKYVEALNASDDKLSFFNETVQMAKGSGHSMGRGWSDMNIPEGATKIVSKIVKKERKIPDGFEWYETKVAGPLQARVKGDSITGIEGMAIPKGSKAYKLGNGTVIIGIASAVAQIVQQGLFPTFKRNHKLTKNYHEKKYGDGRTKIADDDIYDMYVDDKKYDTYNQYGRNDR